MAYKFVTLKDSDGNTLYPKTGINLGTPIWTDNNNNLKIVLSSKGGLTADSGYGLGIKLSTKGLENPTDDYNKSAGITIDEFGGLALKIQDDSAICLSTQGYLDVDYSKLPKVKLGTGLYFDSAGVLQIKLGTGLEFNSYDGTIQVK